MTLPVWNHHLKSWASISTIRALVLSEVLYPRVEFPTTVWSGVEEDEEGSPHFSTIFTRILTSATCSWFQNEKCSSPVPPGKISLWLEFGEEVAQDSWLQLSGAEFLSCRIWRGEGGSKSQFKYHRFSLFLQYVFLNHCFFVVSMSLTLFPETLCGWF